MPIYTSDQNVKSGVPLGGIGAGKLEIMPNGMLDHFTFLNNIHDPLTSQDPKGAKGILGFHFAILAKDKGKKVARLLSTQGVSDIPGVESIKYNGHFPFAHLAYQDRGLPVNVELEAFSPLIRSDEKNSGLPTAIFKFKVTNPSSRTITVSLLGIGRNIIGEWGVGRFNQVVDSAKILSLCFYNKKVQPQDPSLGEMALSIFKNNSVHATYFGEWNMQGRHFVFDGSSETLNECWAHFIQDGVLPNVNTERVVQSESFQTAGALAARAQLKPKSSVTITFALSWHFPNYGEGHMYETWLRNVCDVANYVAERHAALYSDTKAFGKALNALEIDVWLKDALVNNLYPLVSSSMWTKRNRFGLFEAPQVCPLLGTLDVNFYGSLPIALFFPNLELKQMVQFAEAQRPQGYIPHDLGLKRSDLPSNSTNGLLWKDLNSKFILLCWRDFILTGDEGFLRKMYPFIKKAFYWLAATDKNKDFLPDNDGADQTFDLWAFEGASAYTSGIFLASLLALEKISVLVNDADMEKEAQLWFKKGRASFEKKLWYKKYFLAYNNTKDGLSEQQLAHQVKLQKASAACMAAQLSGQWIAHLLGLGYIVSQEKVHRALSTILELNAGSSPFGAVNAVLPSGERDKTNPHSQNCWFGITYSLASLALFEGYKKEGLELAKKAWDNAAVGVLNPWNQPDMYSASDGSYLFGDHYMRNMAIWSVLFALAKKDKKIEDFLRVKKQGA
ncbi:MAG: hypothetical protein HZB36_08075 [Candidatus Omnitrophica bacterium]|nr:hypothetical protein [Candidatus Omnitrophota bacterium]